MAYYVVDHLGKKFGPADVDLLNQWIIEGRLMPHMMLEDERYGGQIVASSVPGLLFGGLLTSVTNYPRPNYPAPGQTPFFTPRTTSTPAQDANVSICLGFIALVFTFIVPLGGVICAAFAIRLGFRSSRAGAGSGLVGMVLGICAVLHFLIGGLL